MLNLLRKNALNVSSAFVLVGVTVVSTGCQSFDLRQLAYSALRHEDCRRNNIDSFCRRSYLVEYQEYERVRSEFLTDSSEDEQSATFEIKKPWRNPDEPAAQTSNVN